MQKQPITFGLLLFFLSMFSYFFFTSSIHFYTVLAAQQPITINVDNNLNHHFPSDFLNSNNNNNQNDTSNHPIISLTSSQQQILLNKLLENKDLKIEKVENNLNTLAFVTPWNNLGYDIAKQKKFNIISPVWLNIIPNKGNIFEISGIHDIDLNWMKEVRKVNSKILPRLRFEYSKWTQQDLQLFFGQPTLQKDIHLNLIDKIDRIIKAYQLDGIVLEYGFLKLENIHHILTLFINQLKKKLNNKLLYLVVPNVFGNEINYLKKIQNEIDQFLIMTYDFNMHQNKIHFNCPIFRYFDETLNNYKDLSNKIMFGINFYGYAFKVDKSINLQKLVNNQFNESSYQFFTKLNLKEQPKVILGKDLNKNNIKQIIWDKIAGEHVMETNDNYFIFYPTREYIEERINAIKYFKYSGLFIWEIGQGLNSFYDLI
ncbi:hypothetical protein ABK040_002094 [Willaertia magna]